MNRRSLLRRTGTALAAFLSFPFLARAGESGELVAIADEYQRETERISLRIREHLSSPLATLERLRLARLEQYGEEPCEYRVSGGFATDYAEALSFQGRKTKAAGGDAIDIVVPVEFHLYPTAVPHEWEPFGLWTAPGDPTRCTRCGEEKPPYSLVHFQHPSALEGPVTWRSVQDG